MAPKAVTKVGPQAPAPAATAAAGKKTAPTPSHPDFAPVEAGIK